MTAELNTPEAQENSWQRHMTQLADDRAEQGLPIAEWPAKLREPHHWKNRSLPTKSPVPDLSA